jgi:integrase
MTGKPEKPDGGSVKIVRKRLADGTVKEYQYDRTKRPRKIKKDRGAIRQLADLYSISPEFKRLSARWQTARLYQLRILEENLDWMTVEDLNDRECRGDFYELRDQFDAKPDKADKIIDALKGLLSWAYERNRISYNHALGIPHLAPSGKRRNEFIWTEDHEAIVYASMPDFLVRAFRFALFSSARQADTCAMRWANYKDGWLTYKQGKTGATVYLPVYALPPFKELIDGLPRVSEFILTTPSGHQLNTSNLGSKWRAKISKTDLKGVNLHWHDLRGTATTRLLEAGCTDAEVAAITGHSIGPGTKLGDYAARSKQLALNAYRKWSDWMAERPQILPFGNRAGNHGN